MRNDDLIRFERRTRRDIEDLDRRLRALEEAAWVPCDRCRGKGEYSDCAGTYGCYLCDGVGFMPYKEAFDG